MKPERQLAKRNSDFVQHFLLQNLRNYPISQRDCLLLLWATQCALANPHWNLTMSSYIMKPERQLAKRDSDFVQHFLLHNLCIYPISQRECLLLLWAMQCALANPHRNLTMSSYIMKPERQLAKHDSDFVQHFLLQNLRNYPISQRECLFLLWATQCALANPHWRLKPNYVELRNQTIKTRRKTGLQFRSDMFYARMTAII
jgi:hypothetical protein